MELLVDSGLTPMQAIVAGTSTSARLVAEDADRGTIAPGKIADLLLVKGSPDKNIQDIEHTAAVFQGGKQLDLPSLEAAIQSPQVTPLPVNTIPALIDDAEREDGRTNLNTMLVDSTDPGSDHSVILFTRTLRGERGHAITILSQMSPKPSPLTDLVMPLTQGAVAPADLSPFKGIQFAVRGDGSYKLLLDTYGLHPADWPTAPFSGHAKWKTIKIPFAQFQSKNSTSPLPLRSVRALRFELAKPAGADAWLEIDDVKLY